MPPVVYDSKETMDMSGETRSNFCVVKLHIQLAALVS